MVITQRHLKYGKHMQNKVMMKHNTKMKLKKMKKVKVVKIKKDEFLHIRLVWQNAKYNYI